MTNNLQKSTTIMKGEFDAHLEQPNAASEVNLNAHIEPSIIQHKRILNKLLKKIMPVDFLVVSKLQEISHVTNRHYQVIVIEEILKLAEKYNWGLCRNHDFFYLYNGAYWGLIESDDLKVFLGKAAEKMGVDQYKARHFGFKEQLFKQFVATANLSKPEIDKDTVRINLNNGTFVVTPKGINIKDFDRHDFITYQLPFDYDPNAEAPIFIKYLNDVLPDKQCQLVLAEFLGYIFVPASVLKIEKTLMLFGTGANGKSVLYEIVKQLLGEHNVSEYSLQSLTDCKGYHRANLANKLVNYASEINGRLEASIFKQLVSGEPVEARLPYGHPFILNNYAKLIFNCNELPKNVEQTDAYFRRFLIIPFEHTIPEHMQDKQLARKIISSELSGVFNWVLSGLKRLLEQGDLSKCEAAFNAKKQYEIESDSVKQFLLDNDYVYHTTLFTQIKPLYLEYREYCKNDGVQPVKKMNFKKRLKALEVVIEERNIGHVAFITKSTIGEKIF